MTFFLFLSISSAQMSLQDKQFLSAASSASLEDFVKAAGNSKNLDCTDSMNNNFLHRLAMRQDNLDTFFAGVRLVVAKNYHQLLVQKNLANFLPVDLAIKNWPASKDQIEASFYSAIMHPDDKAFDQPDKYFWSRLIVTSTMYKAQQKNNLRAKPY